MPVIIGGLEASLRRFAHYDYWDDAGAPLYLGGFRARTCSSYGMGEKQTIEIAERLLDGEPVASIDGHARHLLPGADARITGLARRWNVPAYEQVLRGQARTMPCPAGSSRTNRMRCAASG